MNFGERLKEIRTYDLITQKEIAQTLNIHKDTYGQYERQCRTIPLKHLNTFCNTMNISFDYFFSFNTEKNYKYTRKEIRQKVIAERLKDIRIQNKLNQEQLANTIKFDRSTVSRYETGTNDITASYLYATCSKYHISADYLLGKIDEPKYFD